jgi:phospholipase/carboxylesterase
MSKAMEPPVIIEPPGPVKACVLWLHGLGADGHDFEPVVPELRLPQEMGVRFVFPHAPYRPVTLNGGYVMRAWYDIVSSDLQERPDLEGIAASVEVLDALVAQQLEQGVDLECLVLAGFSQGGVIALQAALQMAAKPAGVLALSTYLAQRQGDGRGLAVFQAHGTQDPIVPLAAGLQARAALQALGAEVEWREYPMPHAVHPGEVVDIGYWLRQRLRG